MFINSEILKKYSEDSWDICPKGKTYYSLSVEQVNRMFNDIINKKKGPVMDATIIEVSGEKLAFEKFNDTYFIHISENKLIIKLTKDAMYKTMQTFANYYQEREGPSCDREER